MYILGTIDPEILKELQDKLYKTFDIISEFDYTVFKNLKNKQFSLNGITLTINDSEIMVSDRFTFDWKRKNLDAYTYNPYNNFLPERKTIEFSLNILIVNTSVQSVNISVKFNNKFQEDPETVFELYVGEEKYLVSNEWHEKEGFEERAFQKSTIEKPEPFDIQFINHMLTKLKVK